MTTLMHYANRPVVLDRSRRYEQLQPRSFTKPRGFWVSVSGEDDWPSWCRSEEFDVDHLQGAHTVTLRPGADILWIEDVEGIDRFHESFAVETDFERRFATRGRNSWPIDWEKVTGQYAGLIIAPYQWSRRNTADWYYGWDCASGCIWNLDAIASVDLIPSEVLA